MPSGAVGGTLYDVIRIVSAAFPFKPALTRSTPRSTAARCSRRWRTSPRSTVAFALIARLALRRFA